MGFELIDQVRRVEAVGRVVVVDAERVAGDLRDVVRLARVGDAVVAAASP
jgi:hypothetical protein